MKKFTSHTNQILQQCTEVIRVIIEMWNFVGNSIIYDNLKYQKVCWEIFKIEQSDPILRLQILTCVWKQIPMFLDTFEYRNGIRFQSVSVSKTKPQSFGGKGERKNMLTYL